MLSSLISSTHLTKSSSNTLGRKFENTRLIVSCEGIPLGNFKNVRRKSILVLPNSSIEFQDSAPQMTARMERMMRHSIDAFYSEKYDNQGCFQNNDEGKSFQFSYRKDKSSIEPDKPLIFNKKLTKCELAKEFYNFLCVSPGLSKRKHA